MKILVGSDYHGDDRLQREALRLIPEVDGYINCGDFCTYAGSKPEAQEQGYHPKGADEVQRLESFFRQVDALGKPWLFLPGNHDPSAICLETMNEIFHHGFMATASGRVNFQGLCLLVVPFTPPCGWNWVLTHQHLEELIDKYSSSPVDVLVTHAPPLGVLDEEGKWYHRKTPTLRPLVNILKPRYFLCGHMHYDGGKSETHGPTTFINAALHNLILEV
ncbi:metallophosphoesterase family protein [Anthocerotibacter panamensis]|uniref:metallophosphoesterase family protein n=1 Tax=Anthocerotibacter panamensis TaxID=2857077 RepID=UPI001C406C67|nr:metallophosphoesterase [Anthocerotibacter panamensis]